MRTAEGRVIRRVAGLVSLCLLVGGCATIQNFNKLEQSEEKVLTASIGSTIFRINKSGDLPNIYGKADIWGGKVDRGYTELRFKGIKENGNLILQVTDINKSSTETTMDRYKPFDQTEVNVSANNTINMGEASTPDQTVFEFDPKKEKDLVIGGVRITFIEVTAYSVKYKLNKQV